MAINKSNCTTAPIYQGLIFQNGNLTIFPEGNTVDLSSLSYTDNKMTYLTDVSLSNNILSVTYIGENDVPQTKNVFLPYGDLEAISYTGIAPISINGDNEISITQASSSVSGYLTSSDWTIFNAKLDAITADNGLTATTDSNVQLGGTLLASTTIDQDGNDFILTGGDIFFESLPNVVTGAAVYYNTSTGLLTYGDPGVGGDSLRFGFATEDDTATENRYFDTTGFEFGLPGLPETPTAFILYYDESTGKITYGDAVEAGESTRFGFSGEDDTAAEDRYFDSTGFEFGILGLPEDTTPQMIFYDTTTGQFSYGDLPEGTAYTVDNGLTASTATNFQLGGTLLHNTQIDHSGGDYQIELLGDAGNSAAMLYVHGGADAISAQGSAVAVTGSSDSIPIWSVATNSTTTSIQQAYTINRNPGAAGGVGLGSSIQWNAQNSANATIQQGRAQMRWTNATASSETTAYDIYLAASGVAAARKLSLAGSGQLFLDEYGDGLFTGTATKLLASTSAGAVIEVDLGAETAPVVTADNGLSKDTPTNVQLGGTGIKSTSIAWGAFSFTNTFNSLAAGAGAMSIISTSSSVNTSLTRLVNVEFSGANAASTLTTYGLYVNNSRTGTAASSFGIYATSTAGSTAIYGQQTTGTGILGFATTGSGVNGNASTSGYGVTGSSSTGTGIFGYTGTGLAFNFGNTATVTTNSTSRVGLISNSSAGTVAAGFGATIDLALEDDIGLLRQAAILGWEWVDPANATRGANVFITTAQNGTGIKVAQFTNKGNFELTGTSKGLGIKSPDGTTWYIVVDNAGALTTTSTAP